MLYTMKAHPTKYAGVIFRSRLEARWAAFFDLAGIEWDYEPIDFDGWSPDFRLKLAGVEVFVEVKPIDVTSPAGEDMAAYKVKRDEINEVFAKALAHQRAVWVMLLGLGPASWPGGLLGDLCDNPKGRASKPNWIDVFKGQAMTVDAAKHLWDRAGNKVRWRAAA